MPAATKTVTETHSFVSQIKCETIYLQDGLQKSISFNKKNLIEYLYVIVIHFNVFVLLLDEGFKPKIYFNYQAK